MKNNAKYILLVFLFMIFSACTEKVMVNAAESSSGTLSVGTIVQNPKPPSELNKNIFPSFTQELPGVAKDGFWVKSEDTTVNTERKIERQPNFENIRQRKLLGIYYVHMNLEKIQGYDVLTVFNELAELGEQITTDLNQVGVELPVEASTELVLSKSVHLVYGDTKQWIIQLDPEGSYTRLTFIDPDTRNIQGSYVFEKNDNGDIVKGMLGMLSPVFEDNEMLKGSQLTVISFDFSDHSQNFSSVRFEREHDTQVNSSGQLFFQCNLNQSNCIVEVQNVVSSVTSILGFPRAFRYQWQNDEKDFCFGRLDYNTGSADLLSQFYYDWDEKTITKDGCKLDTPVWGSHVFSLDELPVNIPGEPFDETVFGALYGSGQNLEPWKNYINPILIDQNLTATNSVE